MRSRRGNYAIILALCVTVLLAFAAISVDISFLRIAQMEAQNTADSAAHAALVELRRSANTNDATNAALSLVAENRVLGESVEIDPAYDITFGGWDFELREFDDGSSYINSVQVQVRLDDSSPNGPVSTLFARLLGEEYANVNSKGSSIGALRDRDVLVVQDVTGSFANEIDEARDANLILLDYLYENGFPRDKIGMITFVGDAITWTDLQYVQDGYSTIRSQWEDLDYCNRSYFPPRSAAHHVAPQMMDCNACNDRLANWWYYNTGDELECDWELITDWWFAQYGWTPSNWIQLLNGALSNGWSYPPAQWSWDSGTSQGTGLEVGIETLLDSSVSGSYALKTIILISDGKPQCVPSASGCDDARATYGIQMADYAESEDISIYSVSLNKPFNQVQSDYMASLVRGYGTFYETSDEADLEEILESIAMAIPIALVQ